MTILLGSLISIAILFAAVWLQPNSFREMLTRLSSQPLLFLLNWLPIGLLLLALTALLRNVCWSGAMTALFFCGTSLASRIKIDTRYEAVIPRDFLLLREVGILSARAVGSAVGRNPISIIIPCHRVLAADGSLAGYAGGLENKEKLLRLEGVWNPV